MNILHTTIISIYIATTTHTILEHHQPQNHVSGLRSMKAGGGHGEEPTTTSNSSRFRGGASSSWGSRGRPGPIVEPSSQSSIPLSSLSSLSSSIGSGQGAQGYQGYQTQSLPPMLANANATSQLQQQQQRQQQQQEDALLAQSIPVRAGMGGCSSYLTP